MVTQKEMELAEMASKAGAIPAVAIGGLVELAKLGLQIYFLATQEAKLTEEEKEKMYQQEKTQFLLNQPVNLQKPPE